MAPRTSYPRWCAQKSKVLSHASLGVMWDAFKCGVRVARQPRVPSVEAMIEFLIGMMTGDVEKGGSQTARDKDWYASPMLKNSEMECGKKKRKDFYD